MSRIRDLTDQRFGKITVIEPTKERKHNAVVWKCRCDCGRELLVESRRLKPGLIYSCGCEEAPNPVGKNLAGLKFGRLHVLKQSERKASDGEPMWVCRCDCGKEVITTKQRLLSGNTRSCGCGKLMLLKDWVGKRFGMLTVLSYAGKEKGFHIWHCRCDCGNTVDVRQSNLQSGWTTSCGCQRNPGNNLHYIGGTCVEKLQTDTMYKTNTSRVRGVYYNRKRNKWIAQIMFKKKCYNLGGYETLEDAAQIRAIAEEKIFGDFLHWYEKEYQKKKKKKTEE